MKNVKKTALITGAYRGIGFEVARQLAGRGFRVFLTARRRDDGEKAAERLVQEGGRVEFLAMDVADPASIRETARAFERLADGLDVLINNAAVFPDEKHSIAEMDPSVLERALQTNTVGAAAVIRGFLPSLVQSGGARVINVSSGLGSLAEMGGYAPAYSISKAALNAVTRQWAAALRDRGVTVNSVCPGWVKTDMGGPDAPRSVPQGADTIVWLATEAPQNLTGRFLRDREPIAW